MHHWIHNLNPVIVSFGVLQIRWYGFMYLVGFVVGYGLFVRRYNRGLFALPPEQAQNLITYIMIGMMIGARITYVLVYNPMYYMSHLSEIPAIWQGGLSFHGAAIGFVIAVLLFGRRHGYKFYQIMDNVVIGASLGIVFGRIGNFINGELPGRVTDVSWGIIFPDSGPLPRHPSQIYQALCEGLLVFIILHIIEWREQKKGFAPMPRDIHAKDGKKKREPIVWKRTGVLSTSFLILYGIGRFVVEFYREPDAQLGYFFGWMTMGQILCSLMIIVGAFLLWRAIKHPTPVTY
jgi:phosphatidylglycerol:prolipoprotein diacylglycerol transferase